MKVIKVSLLLLLLLHVSCKKESITEENNMESVEQINERYPKFIFPDTLIVNKKYNGKILYKGVNDSITTKVGGSGKKTRYILYIHDKVSKPFKAIEDVYKSKNTDTVIALQAGHIDLLGISFSKTGVHYIDGIISDELFFKELDSKGMVEIKKTITFIGHKVVVIDSL